MGQPGRILEGRGEGGGVRLRDKGNMFVVRFWFASVLLMSGVSLGQTQSVCGASRDCGVLGSMKSGVIRAVRPPEVLSSFGKVTFKYSSPKVFVVYQITNVNVLRGVIR